MKGVPETERQEEMGQQMGKEEKGTEKGVNLGVGGEGGNHRANRSLNTPRRHTAVECGRSQNRKRGSEDRKKEKGPDELTGPCLNSAKGS